MKERIDEMFGLMADFTRLRVLHLLFHKELCVAGMMGSLQAPQPKVSQHLRRLRAAGLVQERRSGKWVFYSLTKPRSRLHAQLMRCIGVCHTEVKVFRDDLARMKRVLAAGGDRSTGYRRIPSAPPRPAAAR